jgi:hypothetical protein
VINCVVVKVRKCVGAPDYLQLRTLADPVDRAGLARGENCGVWSQPRFLAHSSSHVERRLRHGYFGGVCSVGSINSFVTVYSKALGIACTREKSRRVIGKAAVGVAVDIDTSEHRLRMCSLPGQLETCAMDIVRTQLKLSVNGPKSICMSFTGKGLVYIPMPNISTLEGSAE